MMPRATAKPAPNAGLSSTLSVERPRHVEAYRAFWDAKPTEPPGGHEAVRAAKARRRLSQERP